MQGWKVDGTCVRAFLGRQFDRDERLVSQAHDFEVMGLEGCIDFMEITGAL